MQCTATAAAGNLVASYLYVPLASRGERRFPLGQTRWRCLAGSARGIAGGVGSSGSRSPRTPARVEDISVLVTTFVVVLVLNDGGGGGGLLELQDQEHILPSRG